MTTDAEHVATADSSTDRARRERIENLAYSTAWSTADPRPVAERTHCQKRLPKAPAVCDDGCPRKERGHRRKERRT